MKLFALILLVVPAILALSACGSDNSNNGGPAALKTPGQPAPKPPEAEQNAGPGDKGADYMTMMQTPWCRDYSKNGVTYEERLHFINRENYDNNTYVLTKNGRGQTVIAVSGTYELEGSILTVHPVGAAMSQAAVILDRQDGKTLDLKLHIRYPKPDHVDDYAYDPCN